MKVLMLNTFDEAGGAARAAVRLLGGVRALGIDAKLLARYKTGTQAGVLCGAGPLRHAARRLKSYLGMLPVRAYPQRPENNFTPALLPDRLPAAVARIDPDIVHLHWLGAGFCRPESLRKIDKPLVWTLHDSWAFTGGCHVPFDCTKYRQNCGACPVLGSLREDDLSRRVWLRKERAWRDLDLTVVAPSRWLADCARSSSLFRDVRVEVIPNGLDTEVFRPLGREEARKALDLPRDKKIILFGAVRGTSDPNKGFHLLRPALQALGKESSDKLALIFSAFDHTKITDVGMPIRFLERVEDDRQLAAIYSAADVFVAPSIQESFCQTAAEALACGTPVVAFGATGLLDVVEHRRCGYLAQPYETADLARGIAWVLEEPDRHRLLCRQARSRAEQYFPINSIASRYSKLYETLLAKGSAEPLPA